MAPPFAAPDLTTQSPRTSLIDAEWEWLARRADAADACDGVAFTDRDTAPGLAPYSQAPAISSQMSWQRPEETGAEHAHAHAVDAAMGRSRRLELAFVAAILMSFAFGVIALPIAKSVTAQLNQDLWTDGYTAELDLQHAAKSPAAEPVRPAPTPVAPQAEVIVPAPAQPPVVAAPVEATVSRETEKPKPAPTKPATARAARRWSPPPRWSPPARQEGPVKHPDRWQSDNPY